MCQGITIVARVHIDLQRYVQSPWGEPNILGSQTIIDSIPVKQPSPMPVTTWGIDIKGDQ